jgi:hypothetical protein
VEEAAAGDLSSRPLESVLDEALAPVDRDVFRRQVRYDAVIESRAAVASGTPAQGAGVVAERK